MCCMRLGCKNRHLYTITQICWAISSQLRHVSTIGKNVSNGNISFICLCSMVNFGPLTAEICWRVWGTPANFNGFASCFVTAATSLNKSQPELAAEFTFRRSLAFSYIRSITARHSSSGHQSNFVAWY